MKEPVQKLMIAGGGNHLCAHRNGTLYIAGGQDLHRLIPVGIQEQLEELLQDHQFNTALSLAATLPGHAEVQRIHGRSGKAISLKKKELLL